MFQVLFSDPKSALRAFSEVFTEEEKRERVMEQLQAEQNMTIIFVAMKRTASWLCRSARRESDSAGSYHSGKQVQ